MSQVKRLFRVIEKYELASGQSLNASKTSAVLLGSEKQVEASSPLLQKHCKQFGVDQVDVGLGITAGTQAQIDTEWETDHVKFREECTRKAKQLRVEMGTTARVTIVKSTMAAKLPYKASVQVATNADAIIWKTQQVLNECILGEKGEGRMEAITNELSHQKKENGGLGHIHLATRHRAEWAALAGTLHDEEEPW